MSYSVVIPFFIYSGVEVVITIIDIELVIKNSYYSLFTVLRAGITDW